MVVFLAVFLVVFLFPQLRLQFKVQVPWSARSPLVRIHVPVTFINYQCFWTCKGCRSDILYSNGNLLSKPSSCPKMKKNRYRLKKILI